MNAAARMCPMRPPPTTSTGVLTLLWSAIAGSS
jgi:hypothetical protein